MMRVKIGTVMRWYVRYTSQCVSNVPTCFT